MERVKQYFISRGSQALADRIIMLPESGATVELGCKVLNCVPGEIAKSVCVIVKNASMVSYELVPKTPTALLEAEAEAAGSPVVASPVSAGSPVTPAGEGRLPVIIVCTGDTRLNQAKFKKVFHCTPKMVKREECAEASGHPVGAVCPFAVSPNAQVFLDISIKRYDRLFPAAGDHRFGIWVTPDELQQYADNLVGWVDVCEVVQAKSVEVTVGVEASTGFEPAGGAATLT